MDKRGETVGARARRKMAHLKQHVGKPCPYCGRTMMHLSAFGGRYSPTRDHVHVPHVRGGRLTECNSLVVCADCNSEKGSAALSDWLTLLTANEDPRAENVRRALTSKPAWVAIETHLR